MFSKRHCRVHGGGKKYGIMVLDVVKSGLNLEPINVDRKIDYYRSNCWTNVF